MPGLSRFALLEAVASGVALILVWWIFALTVFTPAEGTTFTPVPTPAAVFDWLFVKGNIAGTWSVFGPTLAAVLTLALSEQSVARGLLLTVVYCLGLGIPFVLAAVAVARSARALSALRRHARTIQVVGGVVLVVLGLLLVTGAWEWISARLQGLVSGWVTPL